jgi:hypothetical protein
MAANRSACDNVISVCCSFTDFADMTYVVDLLCLHITAHHGRRCRVFLLNRDSLDGVFLRFRHCLEMDGFAFSKINVSCSVAPSGRNIEMGKAQYFL